MASIHGDTIIELSQAFTSAVLGDAPLDAVTRLSIPPIPVRFLLCVTIGKVEVHVKKTWKTAQRHCCHVWYL